MIQATVVIHCSDDVPSSPLACLLALSLPTCGGTRWQPVVVDNVAACRTLERYRYAASLLWKCLLWKWSENALLDLLDLWARLNLLDLLDLLDGDGVGVVLIRIFDNGCQKHSNTKDIRRQAARNIRT